jgi:hypothetical protein
VIFEDGHRVRVVTKMTGTRYGRAVRAGDIISIAGGGTSTADGVPARRAGLSGPVAADPAGNVLGSDGFRVRVVAAADGTFYGQAMTTGDIYTVAGNGLPGNLPPGFAGDGGPATGAELFLPQAVTTGPGGSLVIAGTGNHRVRVVAG